MNHKLTGLPVSKEYLDVLERLNTNENVSLTEIETLPEIQEAQEYIRYLEKIEELEQRKDQTQEILQQLHKIGSVIIDKRGKETYNGIVGRDSKLDIVIGLPASGKSSTVVNPISQQNRARVIDNDEAKKFLSGYNHGWGAKIVHDESKIIIEKFFEQCVKRHENIVLPVVGSTDTAVQKWIALASNEGYSINLHYCEIAQNKALGRMLSRFIETGRFLPPEIIYKYGTKVSQVYEKIKLDERVAGYCKWNNDVAFGEKPQLVEKIDKGKGGIQERLHAMQRKADKINENGAKELENRNKETEHLL